jgi:hypothetical protein
MNTKDSLIVGKKIKKFSMQYSIENQCPEALRKNDVFNLYIRMIIKTINIMNDDNRYVWHIGIFKLFYKQPKFYLPALR